MAQFNDNSSSSTSSPSFLGASRGSSSVGVRNVKADTSRGQAQVIRENAEVASDNADLAQVVNAAKFGVDLFTEADKYNQRAIENQAKTQLDNVNNEFGVRERTDLDDEAGTATPGQINDSEKELNRMQKAYKQGQLSETTYWARVNSVSRQLRANYPAYRDQIDKMVSGYTGAKPANALRRALQSERAQIERQSQAASGSEDNRRFQLRREISKMGIVLPDVENYSSDRLLDVITKANNGVARVAFKERQAKEENLTVEERERRWTQTLDADYGASVGRLQTMLFGDDSKINSLMTQAREQITNAKPISQDLQNKLKGEFAGVRNTFTQEIARLTAKYAGKVPPKAFDARIKMMKGIVDDLEESLTTSNGVGLLKHTTDLMKHLRDGDNVAVLNADPEIRRMAALRSVLGERAVNEYLMKDGRLLQVDTALAGITLDRTVGTGLPFKGEIAKAKLQGTYDPRQFRAVLDHVKSTITDPKSNAEMIFNSVKSLFGKENEGFITGLKFNERVQMWNVISTPEVAQAIKEKDKLMPGVAKQFVDWNISTFRDMIREDVNSITEAQDNRKFIDINYNAETAQFEITPRATRTSRSDGTTVQTVSDMIESGILEPGARDTVERLNGQLKVMKNSLAPFGEEDKILTTLATTLKQNRANFSSGLNTGVPGIESLWNSVLASVERVQDRLRTPTTERTSSPFDFGGRMNLGTAKPDGTIDLREGVDTDAIMKEVANVPADPEGRLSTILREWETFGQIRDKDIEFVAGLFSQRLMDPKVGIAAEIGELSQLYAEARTEEEKKAYLKELDVAIGVGQDTMKNYNPKFREIYKQDLIKRMKQSRAKGGGFVPPTQ